LRKGKFQVFDYLHEEGPDYKVYNSGDTSKTSDSYFFRRVTFQIKPTSSIFFLKGSDIKKVNGLYVFNGGEGGYFITDFKITSGFIKGKKVNKNEWLIEASVGVEGEGDDGSKVKKLAFTKTFKNCN
jgi:hypothetical protein